MIYRPNPIADIIKAAGGKVHSDGNIFFTNSEIFEAAARAAHANTNDPRIERTPPAWPRNAKEVREFIGSNCMCAAYPMLDSEPCDEDMYELTAHDFLSAVDRWADFPHHMAPVVAGEVAEPEQRQASLIALPVLDTMTRDSISHQVEHALREVLKAGAQLSRSVEAICKAEPGTFSKEALARSLAHIEVGDLTPMDAERERLLFEEWMVSKGWRLHASWDGTTYRCGVERAGEACSASVRDRELWAAWCDRAALLTAPKSQDLEAEPIDASDRLLADLRILAKRGVLTEAAFRLIVTWAERYLEAATSQDAALAERERICAAIKAEDDHCITQGDYMLDSDDCIKVARGEWVRPGFSVDAGSKASAKKGKQ